MDPRDVRGYSARLNWAARRELARERARDGPLLIPPEDLPRTVDWEIHPSYILGPVDDTLQVPWPGYRRHHTFPARWRPCFPINRANREDLLYSMYACHCVVCAQASTDTPNVTLLIPPSGLGVARTASATNAALQFAQESLESYHPEGTQALSITESLVLLPGDRNQRQVIWLYYHSTNQDDATSQYRAFPPPYGRCSHNLHGGPIPYNPCWDDPEEGQYENDPSMPPLAPQ